MTTTPAGTHGETRTATAARPRPENRATRTGPRPAEEEHSR